MASSTIEWTDATWNPVTGCDRTSPGCDNCYALTLAARLKGMGQPKYQRDGDPRTSGPGFGVVCHADSLDVPLRWRKPRRVFVNSMSDLFHPDVPHDFIAQVFDVMMASEQHTYQVLTKRPQRMRTLITSWASEHGYVAAPNIWLGTSVETQRFADLRVAHLFETPATVRFLSLEPLLGPVELRALVTDRLDWVIVGGESGPGARPIQVDWVRAIRDECRSAGVAVFVKQLGTVWAVEKTGRRTHGGDWDLWPADLRVRDYPVPSGTPGKPSSSGRCPSPPVG